MLRRPIVPLFALLWALLALAACAHTVHPTREQPSIYVIRHLHRAPGTDPGLSVDGQQAAERLAQWFTEDKPGAIYVSNLRRSRDTAGPLAAKLGIAMKSYDPNDTPALIARVRREPITVLVVGHSNTVPDIVELLGAKRPAALSERDYGDIWHIWGAKPRVHREKIARDLPAH